MRGRLDGMSLIVWRAFYPLAIYLLVGAGVETFFKRTGIALGDAGALGVTGVAAAISIPILYKVYHHVIVEKTVESHWNRIAFLRVILLGVSGSLFLNYLLHFSGITFDAYEVPRQIFFRPPLLIQIITMGVVIPIAEELVFRGLVFRQIRWTCSFMGTTGLSAVFFALFHGNLPQGIYAFFLGLFLAVVYEIYGSLLAPVVFHMAANLTSIGMTRWETKGIFILFVLCGFIMFYEIYQIREDGIKYEIIKHNNPLL